MAATDLCTVEDVRRVLQKPAGDTAQDQVISWLITRASRAITDHCRREFVPTASATREFVWSGGYVLSLAPYDLRSVTSVTLDSDLAVADQTVLTADDYRLRPKPAPDGVYQWVELRRRYPTDRHWPRSGEWAEREVKIAGAWGFASIPEDVNLAAAVTVTDWFRERVAAFGARFNQETETVELPEALPSGVRAMLLPYKRHLAL